MEECSRFDICSAPLCPLDEEIDKRYWYPGEQICKAQKHNKHRWIKKQRSIVKRQTKTWLGKATNYQVLFDASRPRKMSEETRLKMQAILKKAREVKNAAQTK